MLPILFGPWTLLHGSDMGRGLVRDGLHWRRANGPGFKAKGSRRPTSTPYSILALDTRRVLGTVMGNTSLNHNSNSSFRNPTFYHIGT